MCGILSEKRHRHGCRQHANVPVPFIPLQLLPLYTYLSLYLSPHLHFGLYL